MNTATTTLTLTPGYLSTRTWFDWLFAAIVAAGGAYVFANYAQYMDVYEKGILVGAVPAAIWIGWFWRPLRALMLVVAGAALLSIASYAGDLARAESVFWLKYFLSSQSAILWMSVLFLMATLFYWIGFFARGQAAAMTRIGSGLVWAAVAMALIGTMARWYESYLIGPDIGHIPVSNLYEVFVLFCWLTAAFYLYFEDHYDTRALGAFVMLVVSAAVGFMFWYAVVREAHEIQPLVPALKSWWMKLHVPANFIGYGTFSLAAMVSLAYLLKQASARSLWIGLVGFPAAFGIGIPALFLAFGGLAADTASSVLRTMSIAATLVAIDAALVALRSRINPATPSLEVLDDVMYKSIAVGFAFFTIATVLGALWAAEAWGGYWSWDPKETWALIVWLNYAAWLHMRLMKGLRGGVAAWWACVGLLVTTFAFLGVNMFLSGLHSYGKL
ncbi:c-type cytochrome biogenesis protein CcsB [Ramlibacter sp. PS4R-6]|uniref:c-type cytochrome biogenesis protein CcsB n=1 Tax=Ramlibacter sp. PS4R-6 TaxID=3133438 RepID=UPI0030A2F66D